MTKIKQDPETYSQMSVPFESADKTNAAIEGFHDELSKLRKKYKMTDVLVVVMGDTKYEDGKLGQFMFHFGFGDSTKQVVLAAYAYGQTQADHREMLNKILAKGK